MEPDMEKAREMSEARGGAAEYRPQAHEDEPKAQPLRSGYARLKRRHAAVCEMLDRAREDNDGLLRAYTELERSLHELRELHERLLQDLRRTTQRHPARPPRTASLFGSDVTIR
jgi:hypothetical protein